MSESALLTGPLEENKRVVRDRENCRHQTLPGLSQPIRLRFHFRDADEPVWAAR